MTTSLKSYALPTILLGLMLVLMLASSWGDSAIIDELAHIPAGYSYVFLKDYRLNPEHPPLIKILSALPLAFADIRFPTDTQSWREDINGQWTQGAKFLYESGNDPDRILRLMRFPVILLAIFFGALFWRWTERHFGRRVAGLALFFYAFSPTFIAHSRFVTTDLGAAFGFFIGVASFLRFLKHPSRKNILIAGLAFGIAELLKFSLILLLPIYGILLLVWASTKIQSSWLDRFRLFISLLGKTALIGIVGIFAISLVYSFTVVNYPALSYKTDGTPYTVAEIEVVAHMPDGEARNQAIRAIPLSQVRDATITLTSFKSRALVQADLWLIEQPYARPFGQYLFGLMMVLQRASGGNTQYFLGEVSAAGSHLYFPLLYLLKEPLAFHILSLVALLFALRSLIRAEEKSTAKTLGWIRDHFIEFSALTFIAIYWASSLSSNLNIGVRHVLPTFPFIFLLVSRQVIAWLRSWKRDDVLTWWDWFKRIISIYVASIPRYLFVSVLVLWQAGSVLAAYPYYLSYYNELAPLVARATGGTAVARDLPLTGLGGGISNGYEIAVDSNYDWGQDLQRLRDYVTQEGIGNIRIDYFGGGSPRHYFGDTFEPWNSAKGYPPGGGWYAVSATFQMNSQGTTIDNFERKKEDSYEWLKPFRPVARAGTSIFIYQLPPEKPR